ncbi:hypothetical protein RRF57_006834 [Xylaria bambusicola]|uniref:Uncharacterized protein n=1 Tax=Xylaria bambusicola TaxID=326684 RepID=A0AAN7UPL9_9PEZI
MNDRSGAIARLGYICMTTQVLVLGHNLAPAAERAHKYAKANLYVICFNGCDGVSSRKRSLVTVQGFRPFRVNEEGGSKIMLAPYDRHSAGYSALPDFSTSEGLL